MTSWTAACQAPMSSTIFQSFLKFTFIRSVMLSNDFILCHSLLFCFQSFPASGSFPMIQLFTTGGQSRGASASASIFFNEYSGLASFRIHCFDLLVVQETLKSLLQHHSLKTSILWYSAFFMAELSHPYMTTGKNIALTIWTSVRSDGSDF